MVAVVSEESVLKRLPWKGLIGGSVGSSFFIDLSMPYFDKDPQEFQTKCDELYKQIMKIIGTSRKEDDDLLKAAAKIQTSANP